MAKAIDRIGERFGSWTIVGLGRALPSTRLFLCECGCGTKRHIPSNNLLSGKSTRCSACRVKEMNRQFEARAAAKVGSRRGTIMITGWRRTPDGIRLGWRCDCGRTGWTPRVAGPGPLCSACWGKTRARKQAAVRYAGVGYTYSDLGALIGISGERARQIHRDHGRSEVLRRAGLIGRRAK